MAGDNGPHAHVTPPSPAQLIRLQVLTPLSVLVSLGAALVAALALHPSLGEIQDDYLTILTPRKTFIGVYWLLLYVLQIGYCVLLATARKAETQHLLVSGIGLRFAIANFLMALWVLFWCLRIFLASEIVLLVNLVNLFSIWATLFRHPPSRHRPMDFIFAHVPMRMFLLILWNLDVWQNGLLAFKWFKYVGSDPDVGPGRWEEEHSKHSWIAFGVVVGVGLIDSFIVFLGRDFVWALATVYLYVAVLLQGGKPIQIFVPLILVCVLQVVSLVASILWHTYARKEGAIRLPEDDEEARPQPNGFVADVGNHE